MKKSEIIKEIKRIDQKMVDEIRLINDGFAEGKTRDNQYLVGCRDQCEVMRDHLALLLSKIINT